MLIGFEDDRERLLLRPTAPAYLLVDFELNGVGGHCLSLIMLWNDLKCLMDYYLVGMNL